MIPTFGQVVFIHPGGEPVAGIAIMPWDRAVDLAAEFNADRTDSKYYCDAFDKNMKPIKPEDVEEK